MLLTGYCIHWGEWLLTGYPLDINFSRYPLFEQQRPEHKNKVDEQRSRPLLGNTVESKTLPNLSRLFCFCFQPVLVSQVDKYLNLDIWTPKSFGEEFGKFSLECHSNKTT